MNRNTRVRVAAMSDSPKLHTGFGTVAEQLYEGFHNAGIELHVLGFMDFEHDYEHSLPYYFTPTTPMDELAHGTFSFFLKRVKPDIIFILTDPGNLVHYSERIVHAHASTYMRNGREFIPPIVAYTPIEGLPMMKSHKSGFDYVRQTAGKLVFYNDTARNNVRKMGWEDIADDAEVVHHGLDHGKFRRLPEDERQQLKELVGLDKYFVIGSVGANKRTKGFVELIYTARALRQMGLDKNIKFYCHTLPERPTMMGYGLLEIADFNWDGEHPNGVADMFLWRQVKHGQYWTGVPRDNGSMDSIKELAGKVPDTPEKRGYLFSNLDFTAMLNCFDLYIDLSQNEGWGLPVGEAMACGVPTIMVNDYDVRAEIYTGGVHLIEPMPQDDWQTLQTGARLVTVSPVEVAKQINYLRHHPEIMVDLSQKGQLVASQYKWDNARHKMNGIIEQVAEFVFEEDVAYAEK